MASGLKIREDGVGTMFELLVTMVVLFFEKSNTKWSFINLLKNMVGYDSSELFQTIYNKGNKVFNGVHSCLQDSLKYLRNYVLSDNEIFPSISSNSLNITEIEHANQGLLRRLSDDSRENALSIALKSISQLLITKYLYSGASNFSSTTLEIVRITEPLNKFDHLNGKGYPPNLKIDAPSCDKKSPGMPLNAHIERRKSERFINNKEAELSEYLSAYSDQCNIHIRLNMDLTAFYFDPNFVYTYLDRMSYDNNNVVFWSPKIVEFCCEVRLKITSEKFASIIEEKELNVSFKKQQASKHGTKKYRLVVVSSAMFEEAMRQTDVDSVVLAYVNEFPDDIRMFIGIPVYRDGYLDSKAKQ